MLCHAIFNAKLSRGYSSGDMKTATHLHGHLIDDFSFVQVFVSFKDKMKMFVLSLLMVICNQLETTAQDDNVTSVNTPPPNTTSIMDVTSDNSEVSDLL